MKDNYLREFATKVTSIDENYLVLDRTAFYPEGGGQVSDRGQLTNGEITVQVIEVKKHGLEVQHKITRPVPFTQGTELQGILDWEHRYECMRFHTAQHVLSRYLQLNYGLETIGNMVKPGSSRADYAPLIEFSEAM
jgi:misacylated tRNA(Ala) deacylase